MDYRTGGNMNRNNWEFDYTAKKLAEAAAIKRDYRQTRVEWWENKKREVMAEIRESGIEINESLAQQYVSNAGRGPTIGIKPELQAKLSECHMKIQDHMEKVRDYDGWVQVLEANYTSSMKLKHDDWLFFFGKN